MFDLLSSIMSPNLINLFVLDMGIQGFGWCIACLMKTEKFYDLTGSFTFILLSYLSNYRSQNTWRQFVQSHMVMAWAGRLGLFLFLRVMKDGGDRRFDAIKYDPKRFLVAWSLQGVWVFVTLFPTLLLNNSDKRDVPIGMQDYIGWTMWTVGMILEVTADLQKSMFRMEPANKDKFISTGLWSISRHPNYLGEILLWFGLYISASSVFKGYQFMSVLSPVFVHLLITKISGIPLLEAAADKKWGKLPEYVLYKRNTAVLVPFWHR